VLCTPPALVPPGASAARTCGVGCRPPGDVGTGGQYTAVSSNPAIGPAPPRRAAAGRVRAFRPGPGSAFLEITRALDLRSLESRPAGPGGICVGEQARLAPWRSGLSAPDRGTGPGQVSTPCVLSYSLCTVGAKGQRWKVVLWAILRKESMADLIAAASQGNGPRVEVATPTLLVAEFRSLCQ
jgi:hypothetical protein